MNKQSSSSDQKYEYQLVRITKKSDGEEIEERYEIAEADDDEDQKAAPSKTAPQSIAETKKSSEQQQSLT